MRVALPAAVLARSKPYRRSLLKDQGHPTQSRGPHARGPGRSAGSCALIGYRTRRTGLLRTLRLQYTGSIVMTNAVGAWAKTKIECVFGPLVKNMRPQSFLLDHYM